MRENTMIEFKHTKIRVVLNIQTAANLDPQNGLNIFIIMSFRVTDEHSNDKSCVDELII